MDKLGLAFKFSISLRNSSTFLSISDFWSMKRPMNGGKGLAGVVTKGENYFNPFIELMKNRK